MKKIIALSFIAFAVMLFLESFSPLASNKKDGAAPGYTGSPGDSLKDCTACHGGIAIPVKDWMRSNIPEDGYVPGQTYTITAVNTVFEATRFGFEISPQNSFGNLLGTMILTDTARTKFVGGTKYITYSNNGIEGIDSAKWSFDWVAPAAGTGDVTFYGAFNANFNHNKSNDQTFIGTLKVKENLSNAIGNILHNGFSFSLYPNPSNEMVQISTNLNAPTQILIDIIDITGRRVATILNERQNGYVLAQYNTNLLPSGNYMVRLSVNGQTSVRKLTVVH